VCLGSSKAASSLSNEPKSGISFGVLVAGFASTFFFFYIRSLAAAQKEDKSK
jgi:hypothetical protein